MKNLPLTQLSLKSIFLILSWLLMTKSSFVDHFCVRRSRLKSTTASKKHLPRKELIAMAQPPRSSFSINRRSVLTVIGGTILAVPLLAEGYSRGFRTKIPNEPFDEPEKGWDQIEEVTIVFHGAGGQDQYTDALMNSLGKKTKDNSYDVIVDWSDYSQNLLKASFNGQRIGRQTASQLLSKAVSLRTLHVIGISVGAFAADSCVTELKEQLDKKGMNSNIFSQLTLLDPFTQRGAIGIGYGERVFGKTADYAQQYLNTDDPVPSTNTPIPNCVVFDVTSIRPPDIFGHDWPLIYYERNGKTGIVAPSERLARGDIIVIEK